MVHTKASAGGPHDPQHAQAVGSTFIGVFDSIAHAETTIDELRQAGFSDDAMGFFATGQTLKGSEAAGAGFCSLAGLRAKAPVTGDLYVGGAPEISGGDASIVPRLLALGISDQEAKYFAEQLEQGRILVAVRTTDRASEATTILHKLGGRADWRMATPY